MITISHGRRSGAPSEARGETFSGKVWADPVVQASPELTVNAVFFEPGARTHWHRHAVGQVLVVTQGAGFLRSRDGSGGRLAPGDVAYIPAGEEHWHGASPDTYLLHLAISIGPAEWLDAVADEDYLVAADTLA
jgi:quercetin dioxygenase-like cupin family protein